MEEIPSNYSRLQLLLKWTSVFPAFVAVVYIFGFVVLSSYLGNLGIRNTDALNISYLSGGLLFLFLYGLILVLLVLVVRNPTDNIAKSWREDTAFVADLLYYLAFVSDYMFRERAVPQGFVVTYFFLLWFINAPPISKKLRPWLSLLVFVVPLIIYDYVIFKQGDAHTRAFIINGVVLGVLALLLYGQLADKMIGRLQVVLLSIVLLVFARQFGEQVYGGVPREFGGGQPLFSHFLIEPEKSELVKSLGLKFMNSDMTDAYPILYSSNAHTYLRVDSCIVSIRNDMFVGTINGSTNSDDSSQTSFQKERSTSSNTRKKDAHHEK